MERLVVVLLVQVLFGGGPLLAPPQCTVEVRGDSAGGEVLEVTGRNEAFTAPGLLGSSFTFVGEVLQARVGEEALSSGRKGGMMSGVWSDLGGEIQLLSGELAEVIAAAED